MPCSFLTPLIDAVIAAPDCDYIGAANEGDAVAIACGAELGGRSSVCLLQNSGLGNAVDPLTSLAWTFRLPVLLLTTWRGEPGGPADEPQHGLMGRITPELLALMEIPWEPVSPHVDLAGVAAACRYPRVRRIGSLAELGAELRAARGELVFLHVLTRPRASRTLPRPAIQPHEVAARLRDGLRASPG